MAADAGRVLENLESLRALTGDEMGAQRVAWTPMWLKARAWFTALVDEHRIRSRLSGTMMRREIIG